MKYARYYLEKRKILAKDKNKEWPVVMWFNYNGQKVNTTIGVKVAEQNWDDKRQRLKPNAHRAVGLHHNHSHKAFNIPQFSFLLGHCFLTHKQQHYRYSFFI